MSVEKVKDFGIITKINIKDTIENYSLVDLLNKIMDKIEELIAEIGDLKTKIYRN